jgi:hypothetical protein
LIEQLEQKGSVDTFVADEDDGVMGMNFESMPQCVGNSGHKILK